MSALVTVTLDSGQIAVGTIFVATLIGALILLFRWARNLSRVVHAVASVIARELDSEAASAEPLKETVQRELTNNHGSSMKDDLDGLTYGFRALGRQVDGLEERFDEHLKERRTTT